VQTADGRPRVRRDHGRYDREELFPSGRRDAARSREHAANGGGERRRRSPRVAVWPIGRGDVDWCRGATRRREPQRNRPRARRHVYLDAGKPAPGAFDETLRNLPRGPVDAYFNGRAASTAVAELERDARCARRCSATADLMLDAAAVRPTRRGRGCRARARHPARRVGLDPRRRRSSAGALPDFDSEARDRACQVGGSSSSRSRRGRSVELREVKSLQRRTFRTRISHLFKSPLKGHYPYPNMLRTPPERHGRLMRAGGASRAARRTARLLPMGDAGRTRGRRAPERGVVFARRTARNFKLASGTWVHVGAVRIALVAGARRAVADAVSAGHDREAIGALICPGAGRPLGRRTRREIAVGLARTGESSSKRVARAVVLVEHAVDRRRRDHRQGRHEPAG